MLGAGWETQPLRSADCRCVYPQSPRLHASITDGDVPWIGYGDVGCWCCFRASSSHRGQYRVTPSPPRSEDAVYGTLPCLGQSIWISWTVTFMTFSSTLEFPEKFHKKQEPLVGLNLPIALLCASIPIVHCHHPWRNGRRHTSR